MKVSIFLNGRARVRARGFEEILIDTALIDILSRWKEMIFIRAKKLYAACQGLIYMKRESDMLRPHRPATIGVPMLQQFYMRQILTMTR